MDKIKNNHQNEVADIDIARKMTHLPLTVRRSIELLGIILIAFVVIYLHNIIMPVLLALVAAIALLPVYRFLVRKKMPATISIFLTILLMTILLALIVFLITSQLKPLINNFDVIKQNISNHIDAISIWFSNRTAISTTRQAEIINQQADRFLNATGN
ncbi:MAG: AI-2E family transporter, partial [Chitinophagaceae bacterium]